MQKIQIHIPLSTNALPHQNYIKHVVQGGKPHAFKDPKLAFYQQYIRLAVTSKKNEVGFRRIPKWFTADIRLTFKNGAHGDADNCAKSIMDSCEGVIFDNDKWCNDLHVRYGYGKEAKILAIFTESDVQ